MSLSGGFSPQPNEPTPEREATGRDADSSGLSRIDTANIVSALWKALGEPDTSPPSDHAGDSFGPYTLVEPLGEGGFGVVWLAERREPMRQLVALKLIRPGQGTAEVVARFEQERQALAFMEHPNIARVLDGGQTADGRPYFAMELVRGEPITRYCDRHRLSVRDRLQLFIPVCEAVQHAHSKGVIHRDLKPANILVTVVGSRAVPKVIDFGVARALNAEVRAKGHFAERGRILGTPEYMSPEQAETEAGDIDTRADVYSLGAVLYELLTGVPPFEARTLRSAGYDEIRRIIREVEPAAPSTRLSELGESSLEIAERRGRRLDQLAAELHRELEWIPLKAMQKDRRRRYATPLELAEDLASYLENKPIRAGPDSPLYRARKFVARHRAGVAIAAFVLTIVGAALGVTTALWRQAEAAEADQRRMREKAVGFAADFLPKLESELRKETESIPARMLIANRAMSILDKLREDFPEDLRLVSAVAKVHETLATLLAGPGTSNVGKPIDAIVHLDTARTLRAGLPPTPEGAYDLAHNRFLAAGILLHERRHREAEAAIADARRLLGEVVFPPEGDLARQVERLRSSLALRRGDIGVSAGDELTAETEYAAAIAFRESRYAAEPASQDALRDLYVVLATQARLFESMGGDEKARPLRERSLALRREMVLRDPSDRHRRDLLNGLGDLADLRVRLGDTDIAGIERLAADAERLADELFRQDENVSRARDDLVYALLRRASLQAPGLAVESLRKARRLADEGLAKGDERAEARYLAVHAAVRLAEGLLAGLSPGDGAESPALAEARDAARAASAGLRPLLDAAPEDPDYAAEADALKEIERRLSQSERR